MGAKVTVAYDDRLLGWQLGKGHPTNPERARNAIHMLGQLGADLVVQDVFPAVRTRTAIEEVHSPKYVEDTLEGWNSEWGSVQRPDLGEVAKLMFQGTVQCVTQLENEGGIYFSPQGAKHHAAYAHGSGFCVFNDFAWAALHLAKAGERVLYLDTDAHHGDGMEALTYGNTDVMTCSIHDSTIFPGTGWYNVPGQRVYNWPLEAGCGDADLVACVREALMLAEGFDPTVVLVAVGGDGHAQDPLSTLEYSYEGYRVIGDMVGEFALERDAPVLIGGAGGYKPQMETPACWASFVAHVAEAYQP